LAGGCEEGADWKPKLWRGEAQGKATFIPSDRSECGEGYLRGEERMDKMLQKRAKGSRSSLRKRQKE